MLKIFNTISRCKEQFIPINSKQITMYVCGTTVYDLCHIGHGRTFVVFDMIYRYLQFIGYNVFYIRNITDIDDKIILKARKNNISMYDLTNKFISFMKDDLSAINILPPDNEPRVTDCISDIIKFINELIVEKYAYVIDGNVFFSIKNYNFYGKLSRRSRSANAFVNNINKKNDFVLWKNIKNKNEPRWSSPWGYGRPGWHIECSAINKKYFGDCIDIHGGGNDLIFPHHENEIAQSECITGKNFVRMWLHSGIVIMNKTKMSKRSGNFISIRDVIKEFNPEVVRFFFLSAHYRSNLFFSENSLKQAKFAFERLNTVLNFCEEDEIAVNSCKTIINHEMRFHNAMFDDFNTPKAYSVLFDLVKEANIAKSNRDFNKMYSLVACLRKLGTILGIFFHKDKNLFKNHGINTSLNVKKIEYLILCRNKARKNKQWKKADAIRSYLRSTGITLEDKRDKTSWKIL